MVEPVESVEPSNNSIELNMKNYKDYIAVDYIKFRGYEYGYTSEIMDLRTPIIKYPDRMDGKGYQQIRFEAAVKGVSPNFIYNDVVVTFAFDGTYTAFAGVVENQGDVLYDCPIDIKMTIDTNVAGDGESIYLFDIAEATGDYWMFSNTEHFSVNAQIVDVKGTVTPIK